MANINDQEKPVVSMLIPAREEKYLQQTVNNILENAELPIEIIVILDGYWPPPPGLIDHPSVRCIHNTVPRGQRPGLNDAAAIAQGDYLMKIDAHCAVGPGFDRILVEDYEPDMTVIPRMYNLDIETFLPKKHKRTDYMFIGLIEGHLRAQYFPGSSQRQPRNDKMMDETMCCMGPGFFMSKERWFFLEGCDEEHGHWGQQGVEVSCKAWLSGGRLMVNKRTWFAHWFRGKYEHDNGRKGFPYPIRQAQINKARKYSDDLWRNNKWHKQTRTFEWLLKKFKPPTWEEINVDYPTVESRGELYAPLYNHIHRGKRDTTYRGTQILKFPSDLLMYHEAIYDTDPEIIVEIGTKFGGSALYFQDQLDMKAKDNGDGVTPGRVVTIDKLDQVANKDPRIEYIVGSSIDKDVIKKIEQITKGKRTMVVIDGNHNRRHVKWELQHYHNFVPSGQYIVVEDCYIERDGKIMKYGPCEAKEWFLESKRGFEQTDHCAKYLVGVSMGGWVKRK